MTQKNSPDNKPDVSKQPTPREQQDTTMDPNDPSSWPEEIGGQRGPEPTRYGDWEKGGRCTDF